MLNRALRMAFLCLLSFVFSFQSHAAELSTNFESGFGGFSNVGEFSFLRRSGTTPSGGTGPSSGANGTTYYAYLETSGGSAYAAGDQGILQINDVEAKSLSFYYHKYGADMGRLEVEVYFNDVWHMLSSNSGQTHTSTTAAWSKVTLNLSRYPGKVDIRFVGNAKGGYRGDMAIDEITIDEQPNTLINFETNFGGMVNTGSYNLSRDSGGTSSGGTGPSSGANGTNYYTYFETSGGAANAAGNTGMLEYNGVDADVMRFHYHMYGANIGTLAIDKYMVNGWVRAWEKTGQQHTSSTDEWTQVYVDVKGATKLRFVTTAIGGYAGDIAIDEIEFEPADYYNHSPNFETGLRWTNTGTYDWSLQSGATSSGGTGPSSGQGYNPYSVSTYAYVETSMGSAYSAGNSAQLDSPYYEKGDFVWFYYSMIGADIGALYLEGKNSAGNWAIIWAKFGPQTPNAGTDWTKAEVDISNYNQIRFRMVAAGGYRGDIAVDSVRMFFDGNDEGFEYEDDPDSYQAGDGVEYSFCARDNDGIASTSYRLAGTTQWIGSSGANDCHTVNLGELPTGGYTIETKYVDDLGNVYFSSDYFNAVRLGGPNAPTPDWSSTGGSVVDAVTQTVNAPLSNFNGAIAGSASVNGGAAGYNIPIAVVPGRAGMQPNVSLSYSSRSGNGIAGVGWSLSAGGAISRCAATLAQDNVQGAAVTFSNATDKLCLNGQRLINTSGVYGNVNTEYKLELDNNTLVNQKLGNLDSNSTYFEVIYANGDTEYFGSDASSRIIPAGTSNTLTWLSSKRRDFSGQNTMAYDYIDYGNGEQLLSSIKYTGDANVDGDREVRFAYEKDVKFGTSYIAGAKTRQTKRLLSIGTYYADIKVRDYAVNYTTSNASGRSLLTSVQECGYQNGKQCRTSISFDWSDNDVTYQLERLLTNQGQEIIDIQPGNDITPHIPLGDMNGDGVRDWPNYFIDAEGNNLGANTNAMVSCNKNTLSMSYSCVNGDFNKDGRTDSWRIVNDSLQIGLSNGSTFNWSTAIDTDISIRTQFFKFGTRLDNVTNIADYNGDGWSDVIVYESTDVISPRTGNIRVGGEAYAYFHSGDISDPYPASSKQLLYSVGASESFQSAGDMNNDGLPDFTLSKRSRDKSLPRITDILLSSVNGTEVSLSKVAFSLPVRTGQDLFDDFGMLMDVNADGLPDWVGTIAGQQFKFHLKINQGDGTFGAEQYMGVSLPSREVYSPGSTSDEPEVIFSPKYVNAYKQIDLDGNGTTELIMPSTIVVSRCTSTVRGSGALVDLCGDAIYEPFTHGNFVRSIETKYDSSTYQYKALYFNESAAGEYSVTELPSNLVATAEHSVVIDGLGKGLADLLFFNGCNTGGCSLAGTNDGGLVEGKAYFNRNYGATIADPSVTDYQPVDMLLAADNNLGVISEWEYHPLTSSQPSDFYEVNHNDVVDDDHFHFASSMYAVSSFKQSNGIGSGKNTRTYQYMGAMYNTQGRGFRGFKTIVETDVANQIRTATDFKQKFPFSSLVESQHTYAININNNVPFQSVTNNWVQSSAHSSATTHLYMLHNQQSDSNKFDLNDASQQLSQTITTIAQGDVDQWGNIKSSVSETTDGASAATGSGVYTTTATKVFDASDAWPHKLSRSTVAKVYTPSAKVPVKHGDTVLNKTVTTNIASWNNTYRQPATMTVGAGATALTVGGCNATALNGCTTSVMGYNSFGLPTSVAVTGAISTTTNDTIALETRTTITTYTTDGYFADSTTVNSGTQALTQKVVIDAQTGLPTRNTDANLLSVDTLYDSLGRPTQIDAPGVPTQYIRYLTPDDQSPSNDAVAMIGRYQAGAPNVQEYVDSLGRTLRVRGEGFDGRDIYTDTQYDNLGRMTAQSTPYSGSPVFTTYSGHDALGRPTQKVTPATESGEDVTTTYAYNGLTTQITTIASDGHNLVLSRSSNSLGQLTQTIDAKLGKTQYAYDAAGNPVVIKDAANNSIYANYDDLGRKLWVNDPNQGITHFVYNNFAELEKETDANNDTIRYELDKLGRIVSRLTPDGNASFFWDTSKKGLLTSESVAGVSKVYSYDNLARPTAVITNIDGTPYKVETEYDANYGRPKALRYPNDLTIALEYNSLGYLAAEKNAASGYVYRRVTGMDDFGNITNSKLTNNSLTGSYLYSPITGQMFNSRVLKGGATQHYLDYSDYDSYGNIKTQSNLTPGINTTDDFVYDEMQRMTRSSISGSAIAATINYRYDAVGNFKYKSDYSTTSTSAYQYQSGTNRVTSVALKAGGSATFGYDNKGNQTHRNNVNEVSYNVFNKPKSINRLGSQVNLFYDASWSRYKQTRVVNGQTITTHYIDKLYEVEFTGAVTSANAKTSSYISDVAILNIDSNGESIRFTHKDRLGSSTTFTDSNGNVTAYRSYDPFGKPKMGNGSLMQSYGVSARLSNNLHDGDMASRRGFTDHEHLDEVELIHMNGRVYDYNVGRFMGVDPLIQAPGNSQSINPYSYVMNNPLWGTDPSGYCSGSRIGTRGSGSVCGGGAGAISQSQADAVNGSNIFGAIASAKANGAPVGQSQTNSGTGDSVDLNSQANTLNAADGGNTSFHIEENFNTKFTGGNGTSHFEFTKELDGLAANESGNKIGDFNRGLGLVGVASALIKGKSINILKPKSTLLLPNYRLNPVNIGVSKTGKNILFPLAKYASKAGNFLGAAGIGLTILDSRIEYMRASTKVEESVVLAKATLDVTAGLGAILAAIVISNPAGIAVAGTYLLVDYLFDIKGMLRPSTSPKPRRREEELNE